jgi:hypothetical protein
MNTPWIELAVLCCAHGSYMASGFNAVKIYKKSLPLKPLKYSIIIIQLGVRCRMFGVVNLTVPRA